MEISPLSCFKHFFNEKLENLIQFIFCSFSRFVMFERKVLLKNFEKLYRMSAHGHWIHSSLVEPNFLRKFFSIYTSVTVTYPSYKKKSIKMSLFNTKVSVL